MIGYDSNCSDRDKPVALGDLAEEEDEDDDDDGDNEEELDDQPFDCCYDEVAAVEAARRYSPWKDNKGKTVASVASPSKTPKRSKSRPWRVDVMLKKGKGVERSTSSWKQQMRERKQVFQWSGVTVLEDQSEDSVLQAHEEDEVSRGNSTEQTIAPSSEEFPHIIDCTSEPEVIDCVEPLQDPEPLDQTFQNTTALYEFQNAMRALEEQLQNTDASDANDSDNDDNADDEEDMHAGGSIRSLGSAVYPSAPERQEQTRLQANRRLIIQSLEATFTKGYDPNERYTITTMGRAGLDPPKHPKNEYFTVFQRFQRSRLARELASTVALLPTKHFYVVENINYQESDTFKLTATIEFTRQEPATFKELVQVYKNIVHVPETCKPGSTIEFAPTTAKESVQGERQTEEDQNNVQVPETVKHITNIEFAQHTRAGSEELCQEMNLIDMQVAETPKPIPKTELAEQAPSIHEVPVEAEHESPTVALVASSFLLHEEHTQDIANMQMKGLLAALSFEAKEVEQNDESQTLFCSSSLGAEIEPQIGESYKTEQISSRVHASVASLTLPVGEITDVTGILIQTNTGSVASESGFEEASAAKKVDEITIQHNTQSSDALIKLEDMTENEPSTSQPHELSTTNRETNPLSAPSESSEPTSTSTESQQTDEQRDENYPAATKKSKANKWKDRLAKRKSVSKRDSDASAESALAPPESAQPSSPIPQALHSRPEPFLAPSPPPTEDETPTKEKRKSLKWKQRLADKKNTKSSPSGEGHKVLPNEDNVSEEKSYNQTEHLLATDIERNEAFEEELKVGAEPTESMEEKGSKIEKTVLDTDNMNKVAVQPSPKETEKPAVRPKELQNSFMAFDALLRQRQGDIDVDDGDEYSEYTIEETVLQPPPPTKAERLATGQQETSATKSGDTESQYEEITVEQSYMELTIEDDQDSNDSSQEDPKATATPMHAATTNLMNSRMFSTPQVAKEPTITVEQISDDEMTQLTFDQSYVEPIRTAPEAPPALKDKINDSSKSSTKDTVASGSMHGSRKRDSVNGSHRSFGSKTSSTSEKNNKRISDILRKDIWSRDAKVVQEALESIVSEASRGQKSRAKISQFGGVMGIVRAMESHRDAEYVQIAGCNALDRLALDPETQVVIGEMGGISIILDAMKAFAASEDVHQVACAALANVTRHRGSTDEVEGAVQILCASMSYHANNMLVQAKAFGAIANICMDNKDRLQELSDTGGMLAMTMALQQPWPNKAEKHEAISNLSILLRCLAEHDDVSHDNDEEYDSYLGQDDENNDLMSVVSALDDEALAQAEEDEGEKLGNIVSRETSTSQQPSTSEKSDVQCLQKIPRAESSKNTKKASGLEQGSNSTQPTEPTSREIEDENCTVS